MSSFASSERGAPVRPLADRVRFIRPDEPRDGTVDVADADVVCVDVSALTLARAASAVRVACRHGLPVIARTGADHAENVDVLEAAGAVHVHEATASDDALWAALDCAARMARRWSSRAASKHARCFLRSSVLECRSPEEAFDLASVLTGVFAMPQNAMNGLVELLMNAVEHGNLEISHDEKTALMHSGTLYDEIAHRLQIAPYRDRKVTVRITRNDDGSGVIEIEDEGPGFDWRAHLASLAGDYRARGRGIALARDLSFPDLEFHDPGNLVLVRVPVAS